MKNRKEKELGGKQNPIPLSSGTSSDAIVDKPQKVGSKEYQLVKIKIEDQSSENKDGAKRMDLEIEHE